MDAGPAARSGYWTGVSDPDNNEYAWLVDFQYASIYTGDKDVTYRVRCVQD